jgi:hypothetical protein
VRARGDARVAAERDGEGGDLGLFWQGDKPRLSDTRGYLTYQAAKAHVHKITYARKAAIRASRKGDPAAWTRFEQQRAEIIGAFAVKKARIDADCDATEAKAAERRAKTEAAAGPKLEAEARRRGLILDIDRDTVGARGQGSGRFSGSTARMETVAQVSERMTAARLLAVGEFAPATRTKQDLRTLYLTVQGDAFDLLVKVDSDDEGWTRDFVVRYNAASAKAAQAHAGPPVGGAALGTEARGASLAEQLALLATLHQSDSLSDDEFATAKAQLIGTPQDTPPTQW